MTRLDSSAPVPEEETDKPEEETDKRGDPVLSVVIPTFNRANLVSRAIDSVLAQSGPLIEIVVIDDGSDDGTGDILEGYGDSIHSIRQQNRGRAAARNAGLQSCTGEFVIFLDSDDEFLEGHAAALVEELRRRPDAHIACTGAALFDDERDVIFDLLWPVQVKEDAFEKIIAGNFMAVDAVIVRQSLLRQVGGFDEDPELTGHEDWELWARCLDKSPLAVVQRASVLVHFHSANTLSDPLLVERGLRCAADKITGNPALALRVRKQHRRIRANMWHSVVYAYLLCGDTKMARRRVLEAYLENPAFILEARWLIAFIKTLVGSAAVRQARVMRGKVRIARGRKLIPQGNDIGSVSRS